MRWLGNLTLKMDEHEDTYAPGTIEARQYAPGAIMLTFSEPDDRGKAIVRMSTDECKSLIKELVDCT